tara:strand:- start:119 stop:397 length:279 start_codon:yes stop_codon:yes gene_type:complete
MVKRKASAKFLAAGKAWREHLNEYRKKHPKLSLKQQMKGAAKTYKKVKSSGGVSFKTSKYEVKVNRKSSKRSKKRSGKKKSRRKKKSSFSLF